MQHFARGWNTIFYTYFKCIRICKDLGFRELQIYSPSTWCPVSWIIAVRSVLLAVRLKCWINIEFCFVNMDLVLIHLLPGGLTEITEHRGQWNCDDVADDQNIACQRSIRTKNGPTLAGGRRGAGRVSGGSGGFVMIGLPSPHIHIMGILIQKFRFYGFFNVICTCINRYVNSFANAVKFSWDLLTAVLCGEFKTC